MRPSRVTRDAVNFFRQSELPARWGWIESLSPVHLRLFSVELADALKEATITGDVQRLSHLLDDWQATAELDTAPEIVERIRQPKTRRPFESFVTV